MRISRLRTQFGRAIAIAVGLLLVYFATFSVAKTITVQREIAYHNQWMGWIELLVKRRMEALRTGVKEKPRFRTRDCPIFLAHSRCFTRLVAMGEEKRSSFMNDAECQQFDELIEERDRYILDFLFQTLPEY